MKRALSIASTVASVAVVLGLLGLLVWAIIRGVEAEPAIVGSLGTAALGVIGGIATAGYQGRVERRESAERQRREAITPYYERLIEYVRGLAESTDAGDPSPDDVKFLGDLQDKLLLWGRAPMIRDWAESMRTAERVAKGEAKMIESMLAYAGILLAIRKELGHDDSQLDVRDLLRVFVTDIDEHLLPAADR